jgi:hypothetical protein
MLLTVFLFLYHFAANLIFYILLSETLLRSKDILLCLLNTALLFYSNGRSCVIYIPLLLDTL